VLPCHLASSSTQTSCTYNSATGTTAAAVQREHKTVQVSDSEHVTEPLYIAVTYQPALAMATRSPERSLWCAAESGCPYQFSGRIYDSSSMYRVVLNELATRHIKVSAASSKHEVVCVHSAQMSTKFKHRLTHTSTSYSTAVLCVGSVVSVEVLFM
jgi:hypothetical protein